MDALPWMAKIVSKKILHGIKINDETVVLNLI